MSTKYVNSGLQLTITPVVKWLLIANVAIWLGAQIVVEHFIGVPVSRYLALHPVNVIYDFMLWQPFTYMFLHSLQVSHILFNMLMLWFVGVELEKRWGAKYFLFFYLMSGVGAALIYCLGTWVWFLFHPSTTALLVPVLGASGAIFGLLLAYGLIFGETMVHFMMLFPMKAKYFVMILAAVEFSSLLTTDVQGGDVAYLAHLGGLAAGYLTLTASTRWQKIQWNRKAKNRNLRLVVDNDRKPKRQDGPKYWN